MQRNPRAARDFDSEPVTRAGDSPSEKRGDAPSPGASLLETCPEPLRERYRRRAERAASGQRAEAIRLKCLECVCWNQAEVRRCHITSCALWPFRLPGKAQRTEDER